MPMHVEICEDECINCGLCAERAPSNVEEVPNAELPRIVRQPASSEEEEACLEAAEYCPLGGFHADQQQQQQAGREDAPDLGDEAGVRVAPP